jgi:hypothetical protein
MSANDFNARTQFRFGLLIVILTASVQSVILFNNAVYTLNAFGAAFLVIYLAAASCYIALPWIGEMIDEVAHSGVTRLSLLVFCFWVTLEEHVHASHEFKSPEGITSFWALFFEQETAKGIAVFIVVSALLAIVEVLFHLQHHGAHLTRNAYRKMKS